ncbi:MAG: hypothetical protein ACI4EG_14470 [Fusicatenibacter sp.]
MLKVYGTGICRDCLAMKVIFEERQIPCEYISITHNTRIKKIRSSNDPHRFLCHIFLMI